MKLHKFYKLINLSVPEVDIRHEAGSNFHPEWVNLTKNR